MPRKVPKELRPALVAMLKAEPKLTAKEVRERLSQGKAGLRRPLHLPLRSVQYHCQKARRDIPKTPELRGKPLQEVAEDVALHYCEVTEGELRRIRKAQQDETRSVADDLAKLRLVIDTVGRLADRGPDSSPHRTRGAKRDMSSADRRKRKPSTLLAQLVEDEKGAIDRNGGREPASQDNTSEAIEGSREDSPSESVADSAEDSMVNGGEGGRIPGSAARSDPPDQDDPSSRATGTAPDTSSPPHTA